MLASCSEEAQIEERLAGVPGTVAGLARKLLVRCRELTVWANELECEITVIVRRLGVYRCS